MFPIIISDKCDDCAKTGKPDIKLKYAPKGGIDFQNEKT
jgi:hypothetical protein